MEKEKQTQATQKVKVRYEETTASYASQFLVNTTDEELIINFSSGHIADPGSPDTLLPIHTRIALSMSGAARLHSLLGKILADKQAGKGPTGAVPETAKAKLPKIDKPKKKPAKKK